MPKFNYKGFHVHLHKRHRCAEQCSLLLLVPPDDVRERFNKHRLGYSFYPLMRMEYKESKKNVIRYLDDFLDSNA